MSAIAQAFVAGSSVDTTFPLSSDLTGCFFSGDVSLKPKRTKVEYHNAAMVFAAALFIDPRLEASVPVVFAVASGTFAGKEPGHTIDKSLVTFFTSSTGYSYSDPADTTGKFLVNEIDPKLIRGKYRECTLNIEYFGFPVGAAVTS